MTISSEFRPLYQAQFIEPIAENLCVLAERRMSAALALYQDDLNLPDFSYTSQGEEMSRVYRAWNGAVLTEHPSLVLLPSTSAVSPAEHDIPEVHEIGFSLGVSGEDGLETTRMGYIYTRSLLGIWLSAHSTELTDGMAATSGQAIVVSADVDWGGGAGPRKDSTQYFMRVDINLSLHLREL